MIDTSQKIWTPPTREHLTDFGGLPIYSPAEVKQTKGRNITIMSRSGGGKTTLCSTAIESRFGWPMLLCDVDGSSHVIDDNDGIDIQKIPSIPAWKKWFSTFQLNFKNESKFPYKALCLDNMSDLASRWVAEAIPRYKDPRQAYNEVTQGIAEIVRFMRDVSTTTMINVIFNVWVDKDLDPEENVNHIKVQFNPALQNLYPGLVDMIGYLTFESDKPNFTRKLSFMPVRSDAKIRRPRSDKNLMSIPIDMWNPSIGALLDTMIGGDPFDASRFAKPQRVKQAEEAEKKVADAAEKTTTNE